MLVEFDRPTGYFGLIALQEHLEGLFRCKVDVGTPRKSETAHSRQGPSESAFMSPRLWTG